MKLLFASFEDTEKEEIAGGVVLSLVGVATVAVDDTYA
jgi:hypothetical protein